MTALTLNFSLEEMTSTSHADLQAANRAEAEAFLPSILATAQLMERVRVALGVAVRVSSGFRGPSLNHRVGGSRTSQHMRGEACDLVPVGLDLDRAFALLVARVDAGDLLVGQLLRERSWIHVSIPGDRPRERCGEIGHQAADGSVVIDRRVSPRA